MATDILSKIVRHKRDEVAGAEKERPLGLLKEKAEEPREKRPFFGNLQKGGHGKVNIIAEIKRASPSKGVIRAGLDPARQAERYQEGGAAAISVLTDRHFFQGSFGDFKKARGAASLPMIRKDFLVSAYQIYESRVLGADAILLIAAILSESELKEYLALAKALDMDALVEVHSQEELHKATRAGATLVGVNNRNLKTFKTDIGTTIDLAPLFKPGQVAVSESGINTREDILRVSKGGTHNFLIGESLVRSDDPVSMLKLLLGESK